MAHPVFITSTENENLIHKGILRRPFSIMKTFLYYAIFAVLS